MVRILAGKERSEMALAKLISDELDPGPSENCGTVFAPVSVCKMSLFDQGGHVVSVNRFHPIHMEAGDTLELSWTVRAVK